MIRKARRIVSMGPGEILWRIKHALITFVERIAYHLGLYNWKPSDWRRRLCRHVDVKPVPQDLANWWLSHMRSRQEPHFLLDAATLAGSAELYGQHFTDRLTSLVMASERVCRGEFSFLGIEFQTGPTIDWQRDPKTGQNWPSKFHADVRIPFCDGTGSRGVAGDVKHVWELNRHDFLIDCAKAYYLTRDGRFARQVFQTISDWMDANPCLQGVNWAGPLEVAVRAMNWIWAYQFCRSWDGFSADDHLQLIQGCYQHGAYLYRHIELFSSPNNHLVGEATALYLLGSFFPEFDESSAWRERAWTILESQPDRQFYEDGGSTEQATSYHHYCLGFFVLAVLTRMRQELPVPPAMLERLETAFSFSMWMTTPDGTVPRIGDADDSRSIHFGASSAWDFRGMLCVGAAIFARSDMKVVAGAFSEDACWLLGRQGHASYDELAATVPASLSRVFPKSGYAILRSGWGTEDDHLCFDCGPIGLDLCLTDVPRFTHGHADMLSLTLCASGEPVLVDSGFFTFNGCPSWHRYCRDVQGHNTVRVDGASQAKFSCKNAWSCAATPGTILTSTDDSFTLAQGSHSGFYGKGGSILHRRTIAWKQSSYWLIHDVIHGVGRHFVEVFFHFAPGRIELLPDGSGALYTPKSGKKVVLLLAEGHELRLELKIGQSEPGGGWISTSYGVSKSAPLLRFYGQLDLPADLLFFLSASRERLDVARVEIPRITRQRGGAVDNGCFWMIDTEQHTDLYPPARHAGEVNFEFDVNRCSAWFAVSNRSARGIESVRSNGAASPG